ncbi:FAD-dependent oxidoreductase [Brenneria tiliae]|uniref:FAD-dependent oxidoreductase n=1 Tax=Brenneria tiliae TaxID=2914984 RepID=UPI0020149501|nr:FAD-binding protein [Brenneria tiliae]MCL2898932.1 FAD-binding protein [Brenneria tiliae]MCL2903131.1 FAD-binding protein [Brenneria tiliae]
MKILLARKILLTAIFSLFALGANAQTKTYDVDVGVIGGGAGGVTATLVAAENNLSVVLLEKMAFLGGGGNHFEGTYASESPMQIEENNPYSPEFAFKQIMNFHHWRIDPKLLRTFINATGDNIRYMMAHGVEFEKIQTMQPKNANRTWHVLKNNTGATMINAFVRDIKKYPDVTILSKTSGKKLIQDDTGRVTGIIAEDTAGNEIIINAKAVIVATGGFAMNREMVLKYLRFPLEGQGAAGRVGDGVNMMMAAGADTVNMELGAQAGPCFDVDGSYTFGHGAKYLAIGALVLQPFLHVDMTGDRFFDESQPLEFMSNAIEARGGKTWHIINQQVLDELQNGKGLAKNHGNMLVRGARLDNLQTILQQAMAEPGPVVVKANTLDELAVATGMDPRILAASLERNNRYARQGYDEEFYKDRIYLRSMEEGPYYAVKTVIKMFATLGGARVNEKFQVLDKQRQIIPGLYAIGQDAGGLYSDSYDMSIAEGTASAFAITGGRLAPLAIAEEVKK